MASLRDIRKRIRSAKNSQKITKAMKLVAAAKLRRAQVAVQHIRVFSQAHQNCLTRALGAVVPVFSGIEYTTACAQLHPLLHIRPPQRLLMLVLGSDRGLCGAFNSNVLRRAERFRFDNRDRTEQLLLATVGKKTRDFYQARKITRWRDYAQLGHHLTFADAEKLSQEIIDVYLRERLDAVCLVYNTFSGGMQQKTVIHDILPITLKIEQGQDNNPLLTTPATPQLLQTILPEQVSLRLFAALLESIASEHSARMTAMESASRNAKELVDAASLEYNRARQAAITRELMDIVGGAEAQSQAT